VPDAGMLEKFLDGGWVDPVTDEALEATADELISHLASLGPAVRSARRLLAVGRA
jgi:hypothetical protein